MQPSGIVIASVSKAFRGVRGTTVAALTDVHLRVEAGRIGVILGPSGCGKSTLLRIVAGLERPTGGLVAVDGEPVTAPRPDIGLIFQRPVLLPWRTAQENVSLPAAVRRHPVADAGRAAEDLLARVGLHGFKDAYPAELSGGMQARVALARALSQDPTTLLLDEPFAALDAITRVEMTDLLLGLWADRRQTLLFVTHSVEEALTLGDEIHVMSNRPGRIVASEFVDLPRPRNPAALASPAAITLAESIRGSLNLRI